MLGQTKTDGDKRGKGSVAAHATLHILQRFYRSYPLGYQCTASYISNNDVKVSIGELSL